MAYGIYTCGVHIKELCEEEEEKIRDCKIQDLSKYGTVEVSIPKNPYPLSFKHLLNCYIIVKNEISGVHKRLRILQLKGENRSKTYNMYFKSHTLMYCPYKDNYYYISFKDLNLIIAKNEGVLK